MNTENTSEEVGAPTAESAGSWLLCQGSRTRLSALLWQLFGGPVTLRCVAWLFCTGATLCAQDGGSVAGVVISSWDGAVLPGAAVTVRGTTLATQTDVNGRFELNGLSAGDQVLRFSKSGFASATVTDVRIIPGQTTTVNSNLRPEFYELEEYEVTAEELQSQTEVLLIERQNAASVEDVIGSQMISRMGSSSAADVVTKVSGSTTSEGKYAVVRGLNDRYVPVTLNGTTVPSADPYRSAASLDQFPSAIIDRVQVTKAFTPDLQGHASGGNLDIVTKSIPQEDFLTVGIGGDYNTQSTGNDRFLTYRGGGSDWIGMDDGTRALPEIIGFGVPVPSRLVNSIYPYFDPRGAANVATQEQLNEQTRALGGAQFAPTRSAPPPDSKLNLAFGGSRELFGMPVGGIGAFNYRREFRYYDEGIQGRYNGDTEQSMYSDERSLSTVNWAAMGNFGIRPFEGQELQVNYLFSQTSQDTVRQQAGSTISFESDPNTTIYQEKLQWQERNLQTFQFKGGHEFKDLAGIKLDWMLALTDASQYEPDTRQFNYLETIFNGSTNYGTGSASLPPPQRPSRFWALLDEHNLNPKADLTLPFHLSILEGDFKTGVFSSSSDRVANSRQILYSTGNPQWTGPNPDTFLTESNLGYAAATTNATGRVTYPWQRYPDDVNSFYESQYDVSAGYLMTDFKVGESLRLLGGARMERTEISVNSRSDFRSEATGLYTNTTTLNQDDVLPAAGLTYTIMPAMTLRLNYAGTLVRPTVRELAAFASYDPNLDREVEGNPTLQIGSIKNYDLRWDWFFGPGELVSAGLFVKQLSNPIEQVNASATGGTVSWQNAEQAQVYGLEFEARKQLGSGFSVGGNFAWIESEVDRTPIEIVLKTDYIGSVTPTRPLFEQAPYILNLDLSYDNPQWGTVLSFVFNITGEKLVLVNYTGYDIYEQPAPRFDIIFSQKVSKNTTVRLSAKNLFDPVIERTYEDSGLIYSSYKLGRTFGISLNVEF